MRRVLLAAVAVAAFAGVAAAAPAAEPMSATIARGQHGIPHISARDFAGLAYGYGYAHARDNLCVLADTYVTVRGERSRFFGPSGSYVFRGNGSTVNNLNSDFFFQRIIDTKRIEKLLDQAPPHGPRPEIRDGVRGYVAGYNRYVAEAGRGGIKDPACDGEPWVRPIEEIDAYRRFYQLASLASSGVAIDGIGAAQPPGAAPGGASQRSLDPRAVDPERFRELLGGIGSNAYGLGKEATDNGSGMLLGNPHFPWDGSERFYQSHLTIPGKLDVEGGSLYGVPLINIGHTRGMAWSHTVSTAFRFTPFELRLVPGSPTTYLVDGQPRAMTADKVTVQVKQGDGSVKPMTRTLYSTEHGPIFTSILGLPLFPWTPTTAFAMGDANADNFRYLNHFFEVNQAQSTQEVDAVLRRNQGIPWVNTIAADSSGKAYYADISVVPNVPNAKVGACGGALNAATFTALGLPTLDGSRSGCRWNDDADALQRGTFGPGNMPSVFRDDHVSNMNDSYWLTNPKQPLEGFARIIGAERTARSLRTRLGLKILEQRLDGSDGLPGTRFTLRQLQDAVFNNRQYAGELFREPLVQMCETTPGAAAACPVLKAWDGRDDLDSKGAVLFRRFASRALGAPGGLPINPLSLLPANPLSVFTTPFSTADPVNTPRGLNTMSPLVRAALVDAISDVRGAGLPLDATLRQAQFEERGGERIPIHGGPGVVGVFNAINVAWSPTRAYGNVPHGSSYVQAVQFTGGHCPVEARTILTYSLSTDPTSPWYGDQTRMFSDKKWVTQGFCEERVLADPKLRTEGVGSGLIERFAAQRPLVTARRALALQVRLARRGRVTVSVSRGKRVVRHVAAKRTRRSHRVRIPARGLPTGVLRVRISARAGRRERDAAQLAVLRR
jgi:acyl-homoserine-lactone acylase